MRVCLTNGSRMVKIGIRAKCPSFYAKQKLLERWKSNPGEVHEENVLIAGSRKRKLESPRWIWRACG